VILPDCCGNNLKSCGPKASKSQVLLTLCRGQSTSEFSLLWMMTNSMRLCLRCVSCRLTVTNTLYIFVLNTSKYCAGRPPVQNYHLSTAIRSTSTGRYSGSSQMAMENQQDQQETSIETLMRFALSSLQEPPTFEFAVEDCVWFMCLLSDFWSYGLLDLKVTSSAITTSPAHHVRINVDQLHFKRPPDL